MRCSRQNIPKLFHGASPPPLSPSVLLVFTSARKVYFKKRSTYTGVESGLINQG